MDLNEVMFST